MKTKTAKHLLTAAFASSLLSAATAHATLELTLNGQGVYDTDLNITWLANANLAASNTFGVSGITANGAMNWNTAQSWIVAMNNANYLGFNDWRLPTTSDIFCDTVNCTGSEMGHLFYNELGGVAGNSILTTHNANLTLFQNVQSYGWSGTEYAPNTSLAWYFDAGHGGQAAYTKTFNLFATAVRPGGQSVSAVPEPEIWVMLLTGMGLMGFAGWRRRNCPV